jgi:hypothetical protein
MNTDSQKIEIAKTFEQLHRTSFALWSDDKEYDSENERYLAVYENIIMGVYGDCYGVNAEYDEEGELIVEATEFEVEVARFESSSELSEIFSFEITTEPTGIGKYIEEQGRDGAW